MKKQIHLMGIVGILMITILFLDCSKEPTNPIDRAKVDGGSLSCVTPVIPPEGVVTSLEVSKTAVGQWKRFLSWSITKTADPTFAEICENDELAINYTVTVTQSGYVDKYIVSGEITIVNDTGEVGENKTAYIKYVDDEIQARVGKEWITVKRSTIKQEFTIATGNTMIIPYWIEFIPPAGYKALRNVAYVYLKNHAPGPDTPKEFWFRTDFQIPESPVIMNKCVDVTDSYAGLLGKVCLESASETFTYSRIVSNDIPGTYSIDNTVTATSWANTVATASATVTLLVKDCDPGCETAWGGNTKGSGNAWWYYFDTQGPLTQAIYAGQKLTDGTVTWDPATDKLTIYLGSWFLKDNVEPVKVEGYSEQNLPIVRPPAGQFKLYKGVQLTIQGNGSRYYAIHLDICH